LHKKDNPHLKAQAFKGIRDETGMWIEKIPFQKHPSKGMRTVAV
jgi:hypothetical protein